MGQALPWHNFGKTLNFQKGTVERHLYCVLKVSMQKIRVFVYGQGSGQLAFLGGPSAPPTPPGHMSKYVMGTGQREIKFPIQWCQPRVQINSGSGAMRLQSLPQIPSVVKLA